MTEITTKGSTDPVISVQNPLFLHPSDSPHIALVSEALKGAGNYKVWSRQMIIALEAKNKLVFVTGSYPKPNSDDPLLSQWKRCNALVLSWIHNVISSELLSGVVYYDLASSVWKDFKDRFDETSGVEMFSLLRQISSTTQGTNSVNTYYSQLKKLWDENESLTPYTTTVSSQEYRDYTQQIKMMQFLMGLNDSYSALRSQILMMTPLPSHVQAYSMIQNEEKQRGVHATMSSNESSIAFYTQGQVSRNQNPNIRGGFTPQQGRKNNNMKCDHCNLTNHTIDQCYKLIGYPSNYFRGNPRGKKPPGNRGGFNGNRGGFNANNVTYEGMNQDNSYSDSDNTGVNSSQPVNSDQGVNAPVFTSSQYQQIMQMLAGGNFGIQHVHSANHTTTVTGSMDWKDKGDW